MNTDTDTTETFQQELLGQTSAQVERLVNLTAALELPQLNRMARNEKTRRTRAANAKARKEAAARSIFGV